MKIFFFFIYFILATLGLLAVQGLSLVAVSGGFSLAFLSQWLSLVQSVGSRASECRLGSCGASAGFSCPGACGIFPDQGWDPCFPLPWQADS